VVPVSLQAGPRFQLVDGTVWELDDALRRVAPSGRVSRSARLLAVQPELRLLVVADRGAVVAGDRRLAKCEADGAAFLSDERLVVTAPRARRHDHEVILVDVPAAKVLDRLTLDTYEAGALTLVHPTDATVLLDLGEGQDGSTTFVVRSYDDRLVVERVFANIMPASFSPDGKRLLAMPHIEEEAQLFAWPSLDRIAALDAAGAGVDGYFDFFGCFVGPDRVLLQVREGPTVLTNGDLQPVAVVDYEGLPADAEHSVLAGISDGRFATETWLDSEPATYVWEFA
jgi:hypothetical protein